MPRHTATLHKQEESKHGGAPGRGTRPSDDALNRTNRQRLDALSRRYPGKLELRAPNGATPIHLRMQAQAASRLDHIEARVTFTAAGATGSRLVSMGPDQNLGPRGLSPPGPGTPCGRVPTSLCCCQQPGRTIGSCLRIVTRVPPV